MDVGSVGLGIFSPAVSAPATRGASQGAAPSSGGASQAVPPLSGAPDGEAAGVAEERAQAKVMNDRFNTTCQTCKNRRYQDGSDDPGVSFKSPQHIAPEVSAGAVRAHEMQHVTREQASAESEGREVISQNVILHGAICPECGKYYIAGGTTTTVTGERKQANPYEAQTQKQAGASGGKLNATA